MFKETGWQYLFYNIFIFGNILLPNGATDTDSLPIIYSWSSVEFKYDNSTQMETDIRSGAYNPFNTVIVASDFYNGVYYATTPALLSGIPVTLSIITDELDSNGKHLLQPFPDWNWQDKSSCDNIISVFRIKIDELGRMWVIDCGVVDIFTDSNRRLCPPKVLAFDLNNNNALITKYELPSGQYNNDSLPLHVEVQIMDAVGEDTYVYISDSTASRMYVYHLVGNQTYPKESPLFNPEPNYVNFTINGVSFNLPDGLFVTALDRSRDILYLHCLASGIQSSANAKILRNTSPLSESEQQSCFTIFGSYRLHTSCEVVVDYKGGTYLIFSTLEDNALKLWNVHQKYDDNNIQLLIESSALNFVSGMTLLNQGRNDVDVLVTSSSLQNAIANNRNAIGVTNFRILRGKVSDIIDMALQNSN